MIFESITNRYIPKSKESTKKYRSRIGKFQGWISIIINGIMFFLKLLIGVIIGSISVIADAFHTLTDVISSGVVIWGFNESEKPADKEHPYGHGRAEYVATLVIAILLIIAGIEFIESSIDQNRDLQTLGQWIGPALHSHYPFKRCSAEHAAQFSLWFACIRSWRTPAASFDSNSWT